MENKAKTNNFKKTPIEFFDDWAKENKDEGMEKGHNDSVLYMIEKIKKEKKEGKIGIDIGCGNGWSVRKMTESLSYKEIIGIDGSKAMIKKAKKIDPKGNYFCQNIKDHKPKKKYDFVHSMEVLYYLKKPEKFIKEVYNEWLDEDSIFILGIDHYKENKSSRNWPIECGVYMNTKSKKEWEQALKKVGFKSVASWQVGQKKDWAGTLVIMGKKNEL